MIDGDMIENFIRPYQGKYGNIGSNISKYLISLSDQISHTSRNIYDNNI